MSEQCYRWLRDAVAHADSLRDRRPDLVVRVALRPRHIGIEGEVIGTPRNLFCQVSWLDFEEAKVNILLEHINRVAVRLQPYAADLAAEPQ